MAAGSEDDGTPGDTARYIGQMARELQRMAVASDLGFVAYLLRMVEDEADSEAKRRGAVEVARP